MRSVFKKLEDWQKESNEVKILITGKTGTGKSSLLNTFLGSNIADEGDSLYPETKVVTEYPNKLIGDVRLRVWDSPGLEDGSQNDAKYIEQIKRMCGDVDLIIYCIRMSQARLVSNGPDCISMKRLSQDNALGGNMWNNTVIVLTFANVTEKKVKYAEHISDPDSPVSIQQFFREEFADVKQTILSRLINDVGLPEELASSIPILPCGYKTCSTLPDIHTSDGSRTFWLSDLWIQALEVTKLNAQPAMIKLNENRIVEYEKEYTDKSKSQVSDTMRLEAPIIFLRKGAEIGGSIKYFPRVGKFFGAITGAVYGNIVSLSILANQAVKNKIITPEEHSDISQQADATAE